MVGEFAQAPAGERPPERARAGFGRRDDERHIIVTDPSSRKNKVVTSRWTYSANALTSARSRVGRRRAAVTVRGKRLAADPDDHRSESTHGPQRTKSVRTRGRHLDRSLRVALEWAVVS
nr:hypothetical protein [Actinoplanes capillaceus]